MRKRQKSTGIGIVFSFLALCAVFCMTACQEKSEKGETPAPVPSVAYKKGADFVGVVKAIDQASAKIAFYNATFETDETYAYTGATTIQTKNERDMSVSEVALGEVYDIYTSDDGQEIVKMRETADIIMQEGVPVSISPELGQLTVQGVTYAYTNRMVTSSEGQPIQPIEITAMDRVVFRGVKGHAYSLVVTKGHGYIRPLKYKDFVGGTMTVYGEAILPVSKGMLLTVPEGTQKISMVNGELTGSTSVVVKRGQVTEVDMSQYQTQVPDVGLVTFRTRPEGAEVYVNGSLVDVSKPLSLKYGRHSIKVVLEGYNDYKGIINVQDPSPVIRINLGEESAEVNTKEENGNNNSSNNNNNNNNNSNNNNDNNANTSVSSGDASASQGAETPQYDNDHKITVSAPQGAAVYINGTYEGVIPCSFHKWLGKITLTLSKDHCETKSYSIEIPDDNQDISWTFPNLKAVG